MKDFTFDYNEAILVSKNIIKKLKNIHEDDKGHYFYGGTQNNDIECDDNRIIIEDNESRLRKTFKPVGNHLRFIFCRLTNQKKVNGITIKFGLHTCKKYYIPECIMSDI